VISFLPLSHIAERMLSIYMPLTIGYQVNFVESPDTIIENMVEISPTFMLSVPRIWEKYHAAIFIRMKDATWLKRLAFGAALAVGRRFAAARLDLERRVPLLLSTLFGLAHFCVFKPLKKRLGFERLHNPVSAAAPISPDVLRFYHALGVPLRQLYGQTEGSGPTTCHRGDLIDPENTGPPLPGVEVRIAPDGEILVKGPNVFMGYYENPQATTETIVDGWLHSGDVGELDQRGYLKITDRKKDLIITAGGKNVAPQRIERILRTSRYIGQVMAYGDRRKYVTALVTLDPDNIRSWAAEQGLDESDPERLAAHPAVQELIQNEIDERNKQLASFESVKRFRILPKDFSIEDGELTPTLKIKRRVVVERHTDLLESMYEPGPAV
jgi:long-chain acyl-CoA synthetase